MLLFFQVVLKCFVDDVVVEVIEIKFIFVLYNIFFLFGVYEMLVMLIFCIVGEFEENCVECEQFIKQFNVL